MKEIEYDISALHYIATNPEDYGICLSKFIIMQWAEGDWIYGIKCICGDNGNLGFIG